MLRTRGDQWLQPATADGKTWCKLVLHANEIDLTQRGGYSMQAEFINASSEIMLAVDTFLLVAAAKPTIPSENYTRYNYALITVQATIAGEQLVQITESMLCSTIYPILARPECTALLPEDGRRWVLNNMAYLISFYCLLYFKGLITVTRASPLLPELQTATGRRRVDWTPQPAAVPLAPQPAVAPPGIPLHLRAHGIDSRPPSRRRN